MRKYYVRKALKINLITLTLVCLVLLVVPVVFFLDSITDWLRSILPYSMQDIAMILMVVFVLIVLAALFSIGIRYSSEYLTVTSERIELHGYYTHKIRIPIDAIQKIELVEAADLGSKITNEDQVKYYGIYQSNSLGKFIAHVRNRNESFCITKKSGKHYVFSCEHRVDFVNNVKQYMQQ